jgi:hypothetical protein
MCGVLLKYKSSGEIFPKGKFDRFKYVTRKSSM